ncbi:MAG: penicillin-binding protein 1A [Alphaproteobacteria bacterium]
MLWRLTKWTVGIVATFMLLGMVGAVFTVWHFSKDLPDARQLRDYAPPVTTRIYAADGQLVGEFAEQNRIFIPIDQVPERVVEAFIAAEDQRFFEHTGVDFLGILRTVSGHLLRGERLVGASTITQQVAKNFLVGDEHSVERKIREAILAFRIEELFNKDHILELYLNEIYMGRGTYGVASAALNYFGKALNELTVAEVAFLAGLPQAPSNFEPERNNERAVRRRDYVIGRMLADGYITGEEAEIAYATPLEAIRRDPFDLVPADFFVEEVRRELISEYGSSGLYRGGLSVRTTLDPELQRHADNALRFGLIEYDRRHGYRGPIAVMENFDGWPDQLAAIGQPEGAGDWQLAVVLEIEGEVAQLGFADRRRGLIGMPGVEWARPWRENQQVGNPPSRVTDVLAKGDVILVSPRDAEAVAAYDAAFARRAAAQEGDEEVVLPDPPPYRLEQIPDIGGGIVVMDPHTGRVLAMSGGYDYEMSEFNRATQAQRQPGSAFKPFVYLAALDDGFTPASIVLDTPFVLDQGPGMAQYRPGNYSGQYYGPLTLRVGLEKSRNLMTVRLAYTVGMDRISQYARLFGVDDNMQPYLSMALGAGETTVLRMVGGYSQIVNGGRHITPTFIDRIQDRYGYTLPQSRQDQRVCTTCAAESYDGGSMPILPDGRQQIADPRTTFQVVHMLRGVVTHGTAGRLGAALPGIPIGGKTGTTNDEKDAWFIGFTPDMVVGAYVGFDQPRHLGPGEAGGRSAMPIVQSFFEQALAGTDPVDFRVPEGLVFVSVDRDTGLASTSGNTVYEGFIPGTEPTETQHSPRSSVVEVSATGGATADDILTGSGGLY